MEENKPKEEWGIADRYLFEFVLAHQKKSAKNLIILLRSVLMAIIILKIIQNLYFKEKILKKNIIMLLIM